MAPEVKLFTLNGRDPYDTLWKGRAVIIGDAAHPMAPTHAQAGVLALEEAAALEMLFEGVSELKAIQTHLKAYSEHMRPLCARAQILSSYPVHQNAEAMQKLRNVYKGPIPEVDLSFDRSYKDLFYSHNILNEMRELRERLEMAATAQTPPDSESEKGSVTGVADKELLKTISDNTTASEPSKAATGDSMFELALKILTAAKVIEEDLARSGAPKPSLLDPVGPKALPLSPEVQTAKLLLQHSLLDLNLLVTGPTEFFLANCLQVSFQPNI
jgi:hypothetical protein